MASEERQLHLAQAALNAISLSNSTVMMSFRIFFRIMSESTDLVLFFH